MREFTLRLKLPDNQPNTHRSNGGSRNFSEGDLFVWGSSKRADMQWSADAPVGMPSFKAVLQFKGHNVEITHLDPGGPKIEINGRELPPDGTELITHGDHITIGTDTTYIASIIPRELNRYFVCSEKSVTCNAREYRNRKRQNIPEIYSTAEWVCEPCREEIFSRSSTLDDLHQEQVINGVTKRERIVFNGFVAVPFNDKRAVLSGATSTIYKVVHRDNGAVAVVKIPKQQNAEVTRFIQRELPIHEQLKHPNIVSYYGHGAYGPNVSQHFLVMEYVRGGSLKNFMAANYLSKLSSKQLISIAIDVFNALAHVHANGYAHRYINADNVLLTSDQPGSPITAKLSDFNLAIGNSMVQMTNATLRHTLAFIYPESPPPQNLQVAPARQGEENRVLDIHHVAVMMYWMFSGRTPYGFGIDDTTTGEQIFQSAAQTFVPLKEACDIAKRFNDMPPTFYDKVDALAKPDWDVLNVSSAAFLATYLKQYLA